MHIIRKTFICSRFIQINQITIFRKRFIKREYFNLKSGLIKKIFTSTHLLINLKKHNVQSA